MNQYKLRLLIKELPFLVYIGYSQEELAKSEIKVSRPDEVLLSAFKTFQSAGEYTRASGVRVIGVKTGNKKTFWRLLLEPLFRLPLICSRRYSPFYGLILHPGKISVLNWLLELSKLPDYLVLVDHDSDKQYPSITVYKMIGFNPQEHVKDKVSEVLLDTQTA